MQQTYLDNRLERSGEPEQRYTERLLLLALLREEQPEWWSQADLECELPDVMPEDINAAIEDLASQEVVRVENDRITASLSTRHLEALDVICI
jgi:hypothetical protein